MNIGRSIDRIHTALRAFAKQHEAIASNIANVNTPGYKARHVDFESVLKNMLGTQETLSLETTHIQHIAAKGAERHRVETRFFNDLSYRLDDNNVDLDHELALMAENRVRYNAMLRALAHQFMNLQSVITERP